MKSPPHTWSGLSDWFDQSNEAEVTSGTPKVCSRGFLTLPAEVLEWDTCSWSPESPYELFSYPEATMLERPQVSGPGEMDRL